MLPDFKLSLRPNNQLSITCQNVIKKSRTYENNLVTRKLPIGAVNRFVRREAAKCGLDTYYSKALKHECLAIPKQDFLPLSLDLTSRFQQAKNIKPKEKLGYGKTPKIKYFSHKAGQKVRECGAIIDSLCGEYTERCRVVTLTIPSSGVAAYKAISDYSGYAVNRLFQIIRRDYSLAHWFYVYEHQKRGALHLHICVYHEDPEVSEEIGKKLCSKWRDILEDISKKSGVDMLYSKGFGRRCELADMQLDNQAMRLSCGAYFSKYASKNSGKYSDDINSINARKYPPSSFWGRSRELARMCEQYSYSFKYEGIDDNDSEYLRHEVIDILCEFKIVLSHSFGFHKEIKLKKEKGNGTLTIFEGLTEVFYICPLEYDLLKEKLESRFNPCKDSRTLDLRRNLV